MNVYMVFGGTTWGGFPMPTVGTSYDYSAPISEPRTIGDKYSETKLYGFFLRAAKDLTRIEKGGNGTTNYTGTPSVFAQELYNVDNHARFYIVKHTNTTLTSLETFNLRVKTSVGDLTVPQYAPHIAIDGRQAKVLVTDFNAGSQKIIYSTAELLVVGSQDNKKPLIALWVPTGETGEFYLRGVKKGKVAKCSGCQDVKFHKAKDGLIVSFLQNEGSTVLTFDNGLKVVLMDRSTAYKAWQPELSNDPHSPLDQIVLVTGPYLVRSASRDGKTLALTGDWSIETELEVFNPARCSKLTFNGKAIKVKTTKYGSLIGTLPAPKVTVDDMTALLPSMEWKVSDALPELTLSYDDSGPAWVSANKNSTLNPRQPATFPVLYADEYGFHAQNILWRGHFSVGDLASAPTGVFLNVIGGTSHGWSAYLNGAFLGSVFGNVSLSDTNRTLAFDGAELKEGDNVLFVIQDNMGHDQTTGALNPRGILNATLLGGNEGETAFSSWKVAGKAGGQDNIDPIRGAYNEGGLTAERLGWHLPGFDDADWQAGSPNEGFAEAGAKFYRSVFPLDVPRGYDVSLAFELAPGVEKSALRAQLYVNGYAFGKFLPYLGNQVEFPVPPGILNYSGDNTIGLSIWNQDDEAHASVSVSMKVLGVYASAVDTAGLDTEYLRPSWEESRLQYA